MSWTPAHVDAPLRSSGRQGITAPVELEPMTVLPSTRHFADFPWASAYSKTTKGVRHVRRTSWSIRVDLIAKNPAVPVTLATVRRRRGRNHLIRVPYDEGVRRNPIQPSLVRIRLVHSGDQVLDRRVVNRQSLDVPTDRNEIGQVEIGQPGRADRLNRLKRGDRIRLPQGESNPINHLIVRNGRKRRPFDPDNAHPTRRTQQRLGRDHYTGLDPATCRRRSSSSVRLLRGRMPRWGSRTRPLALRHHRCGRGLASAGHRRPARCRAGPCGPSSRSTSARVSPPAAL
ncbi:hypothetical protein EV384_2815 [Micromonospora kangleipakensis]|uniref:Uncharacterized protein n=1 Tax=Micromonospora kangleipakensis TaxID=1077942 RepID=A0A4Q8BBG4_9ACTN|nr:hypothetical protein EV384_2815 [Micromonospora kangleipakensis]